MFRYIRVSFRLRSNYNTSYGRCSLLGKYALRNASKFHVIVSVLVEPIQGLRRLLEDFMGFAPAGLEMDIGKLCYGRPFNLHGASHFIH